MLFSTAVQSYIIDAPTQRHDSHVSHKSYYVRHNVYLCDATY